MDPIVTQTDDGNFILDDGFSAPKKMFAAQVSAPTLARLQALAAQSSQGPNTPIQVSPERMAQVAQQTGLAVPSPTPAAPDAGGAPASGPVPIEVGNPTPLPLAGQAAPVLADASQPAAPALQPQPSIASAPREALGAGLPGLFGGGGGMQVSTTTQVAPKLSRGDMAKLEASMDATAAAERKRAEIAAQNQAHQAGIMQDEAERQKIEIAREAEREAERQRTVDTQMADIQETVRELQTKEVDPNRRWKSMSTGGQIGTAISLMLGALGAALTKGPNYALDMYEKAIDRDIDAQKSEIAKAQSVVGLKNNMLSQIMAKGGSERQAAAALRAQKLDEAQAYMRAEAMRTGSAEAAAQADAAIAAAEERKQKALAELKLATQDRVTIQTSPASNSAMADITKRAVGLPGGGVAYAPDDESARKIREQSATTMSIHDKTNRLIALTKNHTGKVVPGQVKDEVKSLITDLVQDYAKAKQAGAMSDDEFDRMAGLFKDPSSLFVADSRAISAAQTFRQRSDAQFINTLRANRMLGAQ